MRRTERRASRWIQFTTHHGNTEDTEERAENQVVVVYYFLRVIPCIPCFRGELTSLRPSLQRRAAHRIARGSVSLHDILCRSGGLSPGPGPAPADRAIQLHGSVELLEPGPAQR